MFNYNTVDLNEKPKYNVLLVTLNTRALNRKEHYHE